MTRYILIDNGSGYIFGDSADLGGKLFDGSPVEFARALDTSLGEPDRTYTEVYAHELHSNETGYHVYQVTDGGLPPVDDGQGQAVIEAVERGSEYVTTLRVGEAE